MIEKLQFSGDNPQPRFGHTVTLIDKHRAILFGGAVGDTGKYIITGDIFLCEFLNKKFKKLEPKGYAPSSRAAHCSVFVDNCLYVYGGALGGGELADDQLYQLDLKFGQDKAFWSIRNSEGSSPGKRYGHVMVYLRPFLVVFGGNTGNQPVNDVWTYDLTEGRNVWNRIPTQPGESPVPRVYHSAAVCRTGSANGMMVVFGGRTTDQSALNDTWGLRKHRDGRMDWVKAPYKAGLEMPSPRYQHSTLFLGTLMLVVGGRNNQVGETLTFDIYDTQSSEWYRLPSIQKFRHACWIVDSYLYIHGGFDQDSPNVPTQKLLRIDLAKAFNPYSALFKGLSYETGKDYYSFNKQHPPHHPHPNTATAGTRNSGATNPNSYPMARNDKLNIPSKTSAGSRPIRLCPEAMVVSYDEQIMRKVPIDKLIEEHRRLKDPILIPSNIKQYLQKIYNPFIGNYFMKQIVGNIPMNLDLIHGLLNEVQKLFEAEPTLLKLRTPLKIFGDLHGQISDLNRLFDLFQAPTDQPKIGDIESTDYLFLGDYVDRGTRSLETILLLFALKLKYPENIHLLRGAHQDIKVNRYMGLGDECINKLRQDPDQPDSIFQRLNRVFQKMPIAALVEKNIFCVHGGIGVTLENISELENIQRPIQINHMPKTNTQKIIYQLLWSDPGEQNQNTANGSHDYFKTKQNLKFGNNRTAKFCADNNLVAVIRSHEPAAGGIHQPQSTVITVYSCTDYCSQGNDAGIILVTRGEQIAPKILPNYQSKQIRWMPLDESAKKSKNIQEQQLRSLNPTPPKK